MPYAHLNSESEPLKFKINVEKIPTKVEKGVTIAGNVTIDIAADTSDGNASYSKKLQDILDASRMLRSVPEEQRPRAILDLLYRNMKYAYADRLESLKETDPESADWVEKHLRVGVTNLSELIEHGFGVCGHLSVVLLFLAKEAGMAGALMTNSGSNGDPMALINITRTDNGQPLFKTVKRGEKVASGHGWVELRTSDGRWIPVDPSANLVGDTPENLQMFQDANYRSIFGSNINAKGLPDHVYLTINPGGNFFFPGEPIHEGRAEINCGCEWDAASSKLISQSYEGALSFRIWSAPSENYGVAVKILSADPNPSNKR